SVTRAHSKDNDFVTGTWQDGRIGTFRGIRGVGAGYGGTVVGDKGAVAIGKYSGYQPPGVEVCKVFRTGSAPVSPEAPIELFAFMEAADESKRQGGAAVTLESVIRKAQEDNRKKYGNQ